ncbi:WD repeat-containing protein 38 isoform X2 [Rhinatrema bivittatum]|uniref:WD repeat-containing protein 38 isoform X2 n=1 Tax=Rhinatrema bivittatum TaxID=194408 RepID=UPI00112C0BBE|nr:WD repeat-containing protein 38 isoform X2 [Rhinatrema bivittatum]
MISTTRPGFSFGPVPRRPYSAKAVITRVTTVQKKSLHFTVNGESCSLQERPSSRASFCSSSKPRKKLMLQERSSETQRKEKYEQSVQEAFQEDKGNDPIVSESISATDSLENCSDYEENSYVKTNRRPSTPEPWATKVPYNPIPCKTLSAPRKLHLYLPNPSPEEDDGERLNNYGYLNKDTREIVLHTNSGRDQQGGSSATSLLQHVSREGENFEMSMKGYGIKLAPKQPKSNRPLSRPCSAKGKDTIPRHILPTATFMLHFVNSCTFSPDCEILLTCSDDSRIHIWNAKSGKLLSKIKGHTGPVKAGCFSPDCTLFASGSHDCTVRVWKTATTECLHVLRGHSKSVETVCFSPDSRQLLSAGWDRTAILWDIQVGCKLKIFSGHDDVIQSSAFSPNAPYLATGSWDYTVKVWNLKTEGQAKTLAGHKGNISCVCFSVSGMLASGSWDRTVRVWNPLSGALIFLLDGHLGWVKSLSFSGDGMLLATTAYDEMVRIWDCETGTCIKILEGILEPAHACTFTPDGALLLSGPIDHK